MVRWVLQASTRGFAVSRSLTVAAGLDGRLGRGAGVEAEVLRLEASAVQRWL